MIAHDQNIVRPEVPPKALALIEIHRNALEIVIADAIVEHHRVLAEVAQPLGVSGQHHARRTVDMDNADTSARASKIAVWIVYPAALTCALVPTGFPSMLIFSRLEAVTSSNISSCCLTRK